ncbi:MAG: hypothetical protein ABOK23_11440 [Candidatus Methanoperedens sp.]|nr:hypothetical protein [Candidatus Methanoperedens sp.]
MDKQKRISITIPVRSIGLKRFVEKAIKNDEFFLFALENPLGAMKECGVKLDVLSFVPEDFAAFFGALSGVKEMVKKKNIKNLTFEGVFGQAAEIRGTYLVAETTRGFYKDWDINAYSQKQVLSTSDKYFEIDRNRIGIKGILQQQEAELMIEIIGNTFADPSKETSSGSDKQWDKQDAIRNRESTNGWNKNFDKAGLGDIFGGPLINPGDLAALAARIETFTEIAEEVE